MSNIWKNLYTSNSVILLPQPKEFEQQREHDTLLMDAIDSTLPNATKCVINTCRMYLRVLHVSDICNADGDRIFKHILTGNKRVTIKWKWPAIPKPTVTQFKIWANTLKQTLGVANTRHIRTPLGK